MVFTEISTAAEKQGPDPSNASGTKQSKVLSEEESAQADNLQVARGQRTPHKTFSRKQLKHVLNTNQTAGWSLNSAAFSLMEL